MPSQQSSLSHDSSPAQYPHSARVSACSEPRVIALARTSSRPSPHDGFMGNYRRLALLVGFIFGLVTVGKGAGGIIKERRLHGT
jgi:hypothetical protein